METGERSLFKWQNNNKENIIESMSTSAWLPPKGSRGSPLWEAGGDLHLEKGLRWLEAMMQEMENKTKLQKEKKKRKRKALHDAFLLGSAGVVLMPDL